MLKNKSFFASSLLFLFLSTILFFSVPTRKSCFDIDSYGYDRIGHHFAKTGDLADPNSPDNATVQTVGYHFFVGVMYRLFGHRFWPIIWLQIFLTLLSCWLTFCIANYFFGKTVASLAIFLCAINVGFLVYPQFLLAESLVLVMILLFVERFLAFCKTQRISDLVLSGFSGGLSLLVKPSALVFFFFLLVFLVCCAVSTGRRLRAFFLFALCFSVPLFGYLSYNKVQYGYFNLAPMASLNIYHVFLSKVIARVDGISVKQAEQKIPKFSCENTLDERGWDGARALFLNYVRKYPIDCFLVWAQNVSKTMFGLFTTQLKVFLSPNVQGGDVSFFAIQGSLLSRAYQYITKGSNSGWVTTIAFGEAVWTIFRYLLIFLILFLFLWARQWAVFIFFVAYIFSFSIVTGFDGCCRYRILFEPVLIILSSLAFVVLYRWFRGAFHEKDSLRHFLSGYRCKRV